MTTKKKFVVLIEDDWEIMGNGLGNVADLQYLPALALMNIADRYNAKVTFMVDVAHQLVLNQHLSHPDVRIQKTIWDETVLLMKERGFDVQLHLHCQWIGASFEAGHFFLGNNWNVGRCDPADQQRLISDSIDYLQSLLRTRFPEYSVCAFKAGSWGLQPSTNLMSEFRKHNIRVVMGPRIGMKCPAQSLDYTQMEEAYRPYYPNPDDITKVSTKQEDVVIIPLQPYDPDLFTLSKYIYDRTMAKYRYKKRFPFYHSTSIPQKIRKLNPLKDKNLFRLGMRPYRTHLKIGNCTLPYLKKSFDTVIQTLRDIDGVGRLPILIESHTKNFHNHYDDIEGFIAYIAEKYESEVEFSDVTSYCRELHDDPSMVRVGNEDR